MEYILQMSLTNLCDLAREHATGLAMAVFVGIALIAGILFYRRRNKVKWLYR